MMKLPEIENRGFKVTVARRIDQLPRELIEVRLSHETGHVSILCTEEALMNRTEVIYDILLIQFHNTIAPIPDFGRGDTRMIDIF